MDEMPNFDQPHETPADAPKKPRRKPMKHAKHRIVVQAAPKSAKKARKKRRVIKRRTKLIVSKGSSVARIIDAHAQIESLLSSLTKVERTAMLEHLKMEKTP